MFLRAVLLGVMIGLLTSAQIAQAGCNWIPEAEGQVVDRRDNICASLDKEPGCRMVHDSTLAITIYLTEQYYAVFSGDVSLGTFAIINGIPIENPCLLSKADLDDRLVFIIGEHSLQSALRAMRCIKTGYYARTLNWDCTTGRLDAEVECVK